MKHLKILRSGFNNKFHNYRINYNKKLEKIKKKVKLLLIIFTLITSQNLDLLDQMKKQNIHLY